MADLLIDGGKVVTLNGIIEADVLVNGGKITDIVKTPTERAEETIDARGLYVLPGVIDPHVHFREPGDVQKEDWKTGSWAAASGGVTTVLDMPNNKPSTTTIKRLEAKRRIANKRSTIDFGFHFGATDSNSDEIKKASNIASVKFYLGSTTGDLLVDKSTLLELANILKNKGIPATAHCEKGELIQEYMKKRRFNYYSDLRPAECEVESIKDMVSYVQMSGNRGHICHVSSKASIDYFKTINTGKLSVEVTPHHLFLTKENEEGLGTLAKMNPPLRTKQDRTALWGALREGIIDCIATDHAPHTIKEKEQEFLKAPAGVPGVETMLPLLLTAMKRELLNLNDLARLCSYNPARVFNIQNKGQIREGSDADMVLVDLNESWCIKNDDLYTKCGWSPFDGWAVRGKVKATFVRGNQVFDGQPMKNRGMEVGFG
jgi:dihydroorotase (multifunctional complex type)